MAAMKTAATQQTPPQIAMPESATFYDPAAAKEIDTICAVRPTHPAPPPCASTIAFPVGTNIARTIWGVLPAGGAGWLGLYNTTTFPLHPGDSPIADQASHIPPIQIDMSTTTCPAGAGTRAAVPIGCFYHVTLTNANIAKYVPDPDTLGFTPGETIVLLALHLIRKETPTNWTFATFWWQQNIETAANPCNAAVALCTAPDSVWRYYAAATVVTPSDPTQTLHPVFNPYVEASLRNNINTNCLVCHSFAGQSPSGPAIGTLQMPTYGAAGPISLQQSQKAASIFLSAQGATGTDQLWTIAKSLPQ
jgi:hypothetical protein